MKLSATKLPSYLAYGLLTLFLLPALASCNPNGSMYYATKWIWTKKLRSPVTIQVNHNASAEKGKSGDAPFKYIDEESAGHYTNHFYGQLSNELAKHDQITVVTGEADYYLNITSIRLEESTEYKLGGQEEYELSDCRVEVVYNLVASRGSIIHDNEVSTNEGETLKEKTDDAGNVTYRVKSFSIDFENLLTRAADKVYALSENKMAKDQKKN